MSQLAQLAGVNKLIILLPYVPVPVPTPVPTPVPVPGNQNPKGSIISDIAKFVKGMGDDDPTPVRRCPCLRQQWHDSMCSFLGNRTLLLL